MDYYFIYKDLLCEGGAPNDYLELANSLAQLEGVNVSIICDMKQQNIKNVASKIQCVSYVKGLKALKSIVKPRKSESIAIFIGFTNLDNIKVAPKLQSIGVPYVILPMAQVSNFLDYDNPFEKKDLPIVSLIENTTDDFKKAKFSRVHEGKRTFTSYIRMLKRKLYRKTFGQYFIKNSLAVGVFGGYEEENLLNLIPNNNNIKLFRYFLGVDLTNRKYGNDKYRREKINIVLWARVDFYYKGIDRLLIAIAKLSEDVRDQYCFNIVGPDYRNGYKKTEELSHKLRIERNIKIHKVGEYTSGTLGLLKQSDYVISLSRWDGFPRSLREAVALGVPIIASKESNFDEFLIKYNVGYLFDSTSDLVQILTSIVNDNLVTKDRKNASKLTLALSWTNVAIDFNNSIKNSMNIK